MAGFRFTHSGRQSITPMIAYRHPLYEAHRAVVQDELIPAEDGEVVFNLLCNAQPILGEAGTLTIHGRTVCYDPTLALSVDIPDCTWPETASVPASWSSERLYRIRLTAPLKAGAKQVFRVEVVR